MCTEIKAMPYTRIMSKIDNEISQFSPPISCPFLIQPVFLSSLFTSSPAGEEGAPCHSGSAIMATTTGGGWHVQSSKGKWFFLVCSSIMCQLREPPHGGLECKKALVFGAFLSMYTYVHMQKTAFTASLGHSWHMYTCIMQTAFTASVCPPHSNPVSFDDSTAIDCHYMWCMRSYTK